MRADNLNNSKFRNIFCLRKYGFRENRGKRGKFLKKGAKRGKLKIGEKKGEKGVSSDACQSGGHVLPNSDGTVIAIAALAATMGMAKKDADLRVKIVSKIIRQYLAAKKLIDTSFLHDVGMYATGGLPPKYSFSTLNEIFQRAQDNAATAARNTAAALNLANTSSVASIASVDPNALVSLQDLIRKARDSFKIKLNDAFSSEASYKKFISSCLGSEKEIISRVCKNLTYPLKTMMTCPVSASKTT